MNYYISDLHFCCASQLAGSGSGYDEREYKTLEEMHADMLARWNRKVTNGDTVYILGDISKRGKSEELIALVAQLKGHKILVHGNHDDLSDYRLRQLFEEVCNYKEITDNIRGNAYKLVLCHYPILFWNGQHRGNIPSMLTIPEQDRIMTKHQLICISSNVVCNLFVITNLLK